MVCEGYVVVSDGAWTYYYSWPGGELAGEVSASDAAFVSCPYGFVPPAACAPVDLTACTRDGGAGGGADAGAQDAAGSDAAGATDANGGADVATASDAGPLDGSSDASSVDVD